MSNNIFNHSDQLEKKRKEFKELETELEIADILLIHYKGKLNLFGRSIQKITDSYWNHSALVFSTAKKNPLFHNTIIVEALAKGIELHKIQRYTKRPDKYDLGVKRVPGLTIEDKRTIRGYMMQNVGVPYDFPQILSILMSYITGQYKNYFLKKDAFICSGFIQSAFYKALHEKRDILFKDSKGRRISDMLMSYTTPKDLANSDASEWIYNKKC